MKPDNFPFSEEIYCEIVDLRTVDVNTPDFFKRLSAITPTVMSDKFIAWDKITNFTGLRGREHCTFIESGYRPNGRTYTLPMTPSE